MKTEQRGFGLLPVIMILAVVALVGGAGWYVFKAQKETSKAFEDSNKSTLQQAGAKKSATDEKKEKPTELKTYKNDQYGFKFSYPANWKFTENLKDMGRGGPEGYVVATSPSGSEVRFVADYGGKGGTCIRVESDRPDDTENCSTLSPLSYKTTRNAPDGYPISVMRAKYTTARPESKTTYDVFVVAGKDAPTTNSPLIGTFNQGLFNGRVGNITSITAGGDRSTPAFYDSVQGKEIESVLETFEMY